MLIGGKYYHWTEVALKVEELDGYLALLGRTSKAGKNPLTPKGFDEAVDKFIAQVVKSAKVADDRALKAMIGKLDVAWVKMTPKQQEKAIASAVEGLALTAAEQVSITRTIGDEMKFLITASKRGAKALHDLNVSPVFDAIDQRIVDNVVESSSHYIRDAYGRRRVGMSKTARDVVSRGVEAGFDSTEISAKLADVMGASGIIRARSYWTTVSSIYSARSRSYGLARSYDEGGIEYARITSVLDERTTDQCNFLHEKLIPVGRVLSRYNEVAEDPDPESVVALQPFLQVGKDDNGDRILYYKPGKDAERVKVATVVESTVGSKDVRGRFEQHRSDSEILDAGIGFPPYHGLCRTTTVPA